MFFIFTLAICTHSFICAFMFICSISHKPIPQFTQVLVKLICLFETFDKQIGPNIIPSVLHDIAHVNI